MTTSPDLLTVEDLAARWQMHPVSLSRMRTEGRGPRFFKPGRRVLYRLEDVQAYEANHLQRSTVDKPE